jgi:DNA-binding transcriptional ArsR family regulator
MMNEQTDGENMEQMRLHASDAAGLMKALGNESRLMILCALANEAARQAAAAGSGPDPARVADNFLLAKPRADGPGHSFTARHLLWCG